MRNIYNFSLAEEDANTIFTHKLLNAYKSQERFIVYISLNKFFLRRSAMGNPPMNLNPFSIKRLICRRFIDRFFLKHSTIPMFH